jgi:hypothetical protein
VGAADLLDGTIVRETSFREAGIEGGTEVPVEALR